MTLICFSHLRWNFVYQRPQHLLSRFAGEYKVYYIEEIIFNDEDDHYIINSYGNVEVITPFISSKESSLNLVERQQLLLKDFLAANKIRNYIFWYYSPMALEFTEHFTPALIVYDCMDELSAFKFAPPQLKNTECRLFDKADVVFTGGVSLYNVKKHLHHNIFAFPSSIDKAHFAKARTEQPDPADQQHIAHPRFGFFGVLDERFDAELIRNVALLKPSWQFILIGPVIKIDPHTLPRSSNIFYPGSKDYKQLPEYISSWDVAMIPFVINESTTYISPTKTPEYLAAGKPVISTPIQDVIEPYKTQKLVEIVSSAEEFVAAGETLLKQKSRKTWLKNVDAFLLENSWDNTFNAMNLLIKKTLVSKTKKIKNEEVYV